MNPLNFEIIIEAVLNSNVNAFLTPGILHEVDGLGWNLYSTQLLHFHD